jgi:excisionase family DNA binding protein
MRDYTIRSMLLQQRGGPGESEMSPQQVVALKGLREAAEFLGVSIFTLRRLIDGGAIRSVKVGARRLVPVAEIERVAAQGAALSAK